MKFLLTSGGLTNKSIANALIALAGKPARKTTIALIPTAANVEKGDKGWLINDLVNLKKQGFKCIDIVDISALPKSMWLPRLKTANVLFFSGGNTFHLMHWLKKSGLAKLLPKLLKTRVYAGISAGSIVAGKDLSLSSINILYYEKNLKMKRDEKALGFFDFHFRPHLNSPHFPRIRPAVLAKMAKIVPDPTYALDDQCALKIVGKKIEIVGGGKYLVFNRPPQFPARKRVGWSQYPNLPDLDTMGMWNDNTGGVITASTCATTTSSCRPNTAGMYSMTACSPMYSGNCSRSPSTTPPYISNK